MGVSSFGFGGVNAHVVLEEYVGDIEQKTEVKEQRTQIFILSAKNEERLKEYAENMVAFLNINPKIELADITYTLQVGREAFDERLAIIALDINTLKTILSSYCEGKTDIDNLYTGNIKTNRRVLDIMNNATDGNAIARDLVDYGRLINIAKLWVIGLEIDWNNLYSGYTLKRLSLPTYPFAKEKYWMETFAKDKKYHLKFRHIKSQEYKIVEESQCKLEKSNETYFPINQDILNTKIANDLIKDVSLILKIEESNLDLNSNMSEFGFDSISFTQFANILSARYSIDLKPSKLYEYGSLSALITYLGQNYTNILSKYHNIQQESSENIRKNISPLKLDKIKSIKHCSYNNYLNSSEKYLADEPIAIVGVSCMMPCSNNLEEFWQNLISGKDMINEIPEDRWDWKTYYGDPSKELNKTSIKWAGFMNEVDKFDASFFKISPKEAELMDPQQRIFLEIVWKTIEDAGYKVSDLSTTKTGIFVGATESEYKYLIEQSDSQLDAQILTGNYYSIIANRISYLLNFNGPSETIDTACSSSLVAIHKAVQAIREGDCKIAIAGGIKVLLSPENFILTEKAGMLSIDGRCKTFDKSANGYVKGEGAGAILLKPLSKALEDNDYVYALIRGTSINHGGHTSSLTVPNPNAQAELIVNAWKNVEGLPSYLEAHGTGTSLGDPIEINGIKKAFDEIGMPKKCAIGSVKTNIGHLETAAGIAGIIKVLLSIKHKKIPRNLHLEVLNPYIELTETPFSIIDKTIDWECEGLRRAGISSFGFSGVNAHVVLEEYVNREQKIEIREQKTLIFILSAKNEERLKEYAKDMVTFISKNPEAELLDIVYTLQIGREAFDERLAIIASDINTLKSTLMNYCEGKDNIENLYTGNIKTYKSKFLSMINGNTGQEFLKNLIRHEQLANIAELFIFGANISWDTLYDEYKPNRIPLPTYPFARDRYWISQLNNITKNTKQVTSKLHLLIDSNESTLEEQCFKKTFTGEEFYLKDHIVQQNKVLPGAAYLEIANISGKFACKNQKILVIKNVFWLKPIIVNDDRKDIYISLSPNSDSIAYEIYSKEQEEKTIYSQGNLVVSTFDSQNELETTTEKINIEAIKSRCKDKLTKSQCYQKFTEIGLNYGPMFRTMKEILVGAQECFTELEVPDTEGYFILHPSIIDGAFQSVLGLMQNNNGIYLPFAVDEIEILKPTATKCYVYTKLVNDTKFDIVIADTGGNVLVKIKGFEVRLLPKQTKVSDVVYLSNVWEKEDLLMKDENISDIVIFDSEDGLYKDLGDKYNCQVTKVLDNELPIYSVFDKVQELLTQKSSDKTKLIYISRNSTPEELAISGFFKNTTIGKS